MDESLHPGEAPESYVSRVAEAKALAVVQRLGSPVLPVLAADTAVVLDGSILGKPRDRSDGIAMLGRLAGRSHQVLSAVALWHGGRIQRAVSLSRVAFRAITPEEAAAYWASGEPTDKAGGYGIQGLGGVFVESLDGSYSGVMGLPLFETAALLKETGIHVLS